MKRVPLGWLRSGNLMVRVCVGGIVAEADRRHWHHQGSRMAREHAGSIVGAAGQGVVETVVECCCMEVAGCSHQWRDKASPQLLSLWNGKP